MDVVREDMEAVGVMGRMWKTVKIMERCDPLWRPLTGSAERQMKEEVYAAASSVTED